MTYAVTHPSRIALERLVVGILATTAFLAYSTATAFFFETTSAAEPSLTATQNEQNLQMIPLLRAATHPDPNPAKGGGDILVEDGVLVPQGDASGAHGTVSAIQNGEISTYTVRDGDTLSQIAEMFDVSAKTILWANDLTNANQIHPGDALIILPITGVRHVVKTGDTLKSIAQKYNGDVDDIIAYNQLASASDISAGDTIVIPDGTIAAASTKTATAVKPQSSSGTKKSSAGYFTNPVPGAVKTQGIHGYNGIDLGAAEGTPIHAAAAGSVIVAKSSGWNGGYGIYAVIKHGNGTQTLYAHMSSIGVSQGDTVAQGDVIGRVGHTGQTSGPTGNHLHFEVRGATNPF